MSAFVRRNSAQAILSLLLGIALVLAGTAAFAQTSEPQPRVAYAMHSARINQIRATPDYSKLITVSQDKTARIWRMRDLRLLRTIYVPSEPGEEGALRTLAITPDGRDVLVGGWTGIAWRKEGQLYRFDIATGRLKQTLRGFPSLIESLAISRDGNRLAVGLGMGGLRIIDLTTGRTVFQDTEYAERISFADFSVDGMLATTSQDGCLRIYDVQQKLVFRAQYPPQVDASGKSCRGSELGGVRFSPDGRLLAFGVQDRVTMVVMDAKTLQLERELTVQDPQQRSLCCLNWSADSRFLFMNGAHSGSGPTPLYRVDLPDYSMIRLDVGSQRFTNILPLPDGDVVFSTNVPSLVRVDARGARVAQALPPNGDFRFDWQQFRISAAADKITLPINGAVRYFGIGEEPDRAYRPAQANDIAGTVPPRRDGMQRVQAQLDDYGYKKPVNINDRKLALKPFQSARSWAAAPRRRVVAVGTQWSVLLADEHANIVWERDLPAPALQVAISDNERWMVAAIGDGTVRWFALDNGDETIGLFAHANGRDWVAWRSDGYYASSPGGDEYIGWLVNRGDTQAPDFYRAIQFERKLYRPDLLATTLSAAPRQVVSGEASLHDVLTALAAPRVTIEAITVVDDDNIALRFSAESTGKPIREIGVYADGIPLLPGQQRTTLSDAGSNRFSREVRLPRSVASHAIRVEAETETALGIDETSSLLPDVKRYRAGRLHVLAIGVNRFEDTRTCSETNSCKVKVRDLPNAPNDAEYLARQLAGQGTSLFSEVTTAVLTDNEATKPTKREILQALKALEQAGPDDTTVVFLASHGFATGARASEYYFLPSDGHMADIASLFADDAPGRAVTASSLLTSTELNDALRRVAGRRLLIIDTCQSEVAGLGSNPYSLAKRSASAQIGVMSAASGNEQSYEALGKKHGAFTAALLGSLEANSDINRDGVVTVDETFALIPPLVAENMQALNQRARLRNSRFVGRTQTPVMMAIPAIAESPLVGVNANQRAK